MSAGQWLTIIIVMMALLASALVLVIDNWISGMVNELNKAELRMLAETAMPGDWFKAGNLLCFDVKTGESHGLNVEDDRFIASASPAAVLSLLDQCDKAEAERDAALAELAELREQACALEIWREMAFKAHPNIDIDIEALK